MHLRLQDFKSVSDYNSMLLQQQYQEHRFTKYSELISCLLVAEQNNELLLKNHQSRLIESMSLPEANATSVQTLGHGEGRVQTLNFVPLAHVFKFVFSAPQ